LVSISRISGGGSILGGMSGTVGCGSGMCGGSIQDLRWVIIWVVRVGGGSGWYGLCWIGWLGMSLLDMECWEKMLMSSSS